MPVESSRNTITNAQYTLLSKMIIDGILRTDEEIACLVHKMERNSRKEILADCYIQLFLSRPESIQLVNAALPPTPREELMPAVRQVVERYKNMDAASRLDFSLKSHPNWIRIALEGEDATYTPTRSEVVLDWADELKLLAKSLLKQQVISCISAESRTQSSGSDSILTDQTSENYGFKTLVLDGGNPLEMMDPQVETHQNFLAELAKTSRKQELYGTLFLQRRKYIRAYVNIWDDQTLEKRYRDTSEQCELINVVGFQAPNPNLPKTKRGDSLLLNLVDFAFVFSSESDCRRFNQLIEENKAEAPLRLRTFLEAAFPELITTPPDEHTERNRPGITLAPTDTVVVVTNKLEITKVPQGRFRKTNWYSAPVHRVFTSGK